MLSMPKDTSLFIPLETENVLFLVQRVFFGFSVCLHIPALFCLIKETPAHQAQIKPNLILVQVTFKYYPSHFAILFRADISWDDANILNLLYHGRSFMISMTKTQIAVIVIDLFDTVFFEKVPIAEAFLGYCKGILCRVLQPTVVSVSVPFIPPFQGKNLGIVPSELMKWFDDTFHLQIFKKLYEQSSHHQPSDKCF